jgi:hypothetical protein
VSDNDRVEGIVLRAETTMTTLVHCSLLEGVIFGESGVLGVVLVVVVLLLIGLKYCSEIFIS